MTYQLRETTIEPVKIPITAHQRVQKRWVFDGKAATITIDHLDLSLPGVTYVTYNVKNSTNSIRISSDSEELLQVIRVEPISSTGLKMRMSSTGHGKGYLLTEISLTSPTQLKTLTCSGSGVVVVEDNVLATNHKKKPNTHLHVSLSGSGDVFVASTSELNVGSLALSLTGSGNVQFVAPAVHATEKVEIAVTSSGDIRAFANTIATAELRLRLSGSGDLQLAASDANINQYLQAQLSGSGDINAFCDSIVAANAIKFSIAGSGDVRLVAKSKLHAPSMETSIAGSGDVTVATNAGKTDTQRVSIVGSGNVDVGDVVTGTAHINIMGSGDVTTCVTEAVEALHLGSGTIKYIGTAPSTQTGWSAKSSSSNESTTRKPGILLDYLLSKEKNLIPIPAKTEAFNDHFRVRSNGIVGGFSGVVTGLSNMLSFVGPSPANKQTASDIS